MMCPFSAFSQFLIVLITLLLALHVVFAKSLKVNFSSNTDNVVTMYDTMKVNYEIIEPPDSLEYLIMYSKDPNIAYVNKEIVLSTSQPNLKGSFNISGNFLGKTVITCKNKVTGEHCNGSFEVTVIRKKRLIDTIFSASVAMLVSVLYINFGCAIDWTELKHILKRPIGPCIGFFGQFIIMPMLSYVVGIILFPENPEMQLGMFFTGVSPAGGASNVWAVVLEGNMSLSIIMTTISTIAAFGMMPLWIFTLGRVIFKNAKLEVPYQHICTYVAALVIPLAIGYLIQRYLQKTAHFMKRILKGFSTCLILFIIIFAIVTNLYLFKLFSWKIIVAGMLLPWVGYMAGYFLGMIFNQSTTDSLTIAIEVGIQNTGIAIFLLRFALPQPEGDLTTIAPVAVAILTPFPLILCYLSKKLKSRLYGSHNKLRCKEEIIKTDNNANDEITPINIRTLS